MKRTCIFILPATLGVAGLAWAGLPTPLSFENQTSSRIVQTVAEGTSNEKEVELADLDNDGDLDMVIAIGSSDFGERKNKLYFNDGGVFTQSSMIPEFNQTDVSRNVFARDYDGDGWKDLYFINDSNSGGFAGLDHMYMAEHSGGVLTGYTDEGPSRIPSGGALGAACGGVSADFDQDGDMDVYSGNYPGPSQDRGLYNNGNGFLSDLTGTMIPADSDYTVDIALADMNGDGKTDLLVSNDFDPNFIYYNDNNGAGSGVGDYRYTNSTQNLGTASQGENSMEPADFDNDGDLDVYWSGRNGSGNDRILRNDGNDGSNKAILTVIDPIPSSINGVRRKASIADFNNDGRWDVFVAAQSTGRPAVLRNTTVGGVISFVDWSPSPAFPTGASMRGWHGGVADTNGDGDVDIVIGAFSNDHLIETIQPSTVDEDALGAVSLPPLWNLHPAAVLGHAADAEVDVYDANLGIGLLSVVLNGPDDYRLEILDGATVVATSDRGGLGVEEALQVAVNGDRSIRVTVLESAGGGGGSPADFNMDGIVDFADLLQLLSVWGCVGCPEDIDGGGAGFGDLLQVLAQWGPVPGGSTDYLLEVLGRSG